ncbi:FxLYD domain-containing protein [Natrialba asiatica]|uniref:Uncharacterized protein n=1 Tax=Natrialba asiatica (strain ATCC 700177 / DSM 12278 / JCM 9576 / FERM P-10747 / NBRC 102637 / 172P1) TaxID=29540 RepID=M0AIV4_NATA1|nr:FxLYD domain-containing protein [Natrialba asiatica]ELY98625.1 hypothetical protein C481_16902 [Natrialba asiatica DSM 12278]
MTRSPNSSQEPRHTTQPDRTRRDGRHRRHVLASLGLGATAALAGCTSIGTNVGVETGPSYERGQIDPPSDAGNRSAEQLTAAAALAEQETQEGVTPLNRLEITSHEFTFESGFKGSTIQGTIENTGAERVRRAEVRVRAYNEMGEQLGRYLSTNGDLDSGGVWAFTVIILKSPSVLDEYDITVLGTPS